MSEVAKNAVVTIVLADFAANEASGKANVIGAGAAILGYEPAMGITSRFALWISVRLPTSLAPVEVPVEISLVDAQGNPVLLPGPAGEPQAMRIAQMTQFEKPTVQVQTLLRDHIGSSVQIVLDFSNGLPLAPNGVFNWQVRIDGDADLQWHYPFAVAGPPTPPVIG